MMTTHRRHHAAAGHGHGPTSTTQRLWLSIGLNLTITAAEVAGGLVSGSLALLSDAMHNLNDTASLGISLAARRIGARPADARLTYGYKRAEILGAFVNLIVLTIIALFLIKEAVSRYLHPRVIHSPIMMSVAAVGLLANLVTALLLFRDARTSLNLRSAFLHIVSDTISSVAVLAGGIVILLTGAFWVDTLLTVIIATYIIAQSVSLLRETGHILMQGTPAHVDLEAVRTRLAGMAHVQDVHDIRVWSLDEHTALLSAHLLVDQPDLPRIERIKADARRELATGFDIHDSTLEVELPGGSCPAAREET